MSAGLPGVGLLGLVGAVLLARPPASDHQRRPAAGKRAAYRTEQRDVAIELVSRYHLEAVVCV